MAPLGEVNNLLIYSAQQLGVMLGVGAQTVILAALLVGMHAHTTGDLFVRAARHARGAGLFFIIISGLAAVGLHLAADAYEILLAPAFLFKWLLVIGVLALHALDRFAWWRTHLEGVAGASWYAIFLVHTLAPITTWADLVILYAAWTVVFMLAWTLFGYVMNRTPRSATTRVIAEPAPIIPVAPAVVIKKNESFAPKPVAASAPVVEPAAAPIIKVVAPVSTLKPVVVAPVPVQPLIKIVTPPPPPVKPVIHPPIPAALQVPKPPAAPPPAVVQPHPLVPAKHPIQLTAPIPVVPKPTLTHTPPKAAPVEPKNVFSLPIIRIMPQRPEDIHPEHGAAVVHLTPKAA